MNIQYIHLTFYNCLLAALDELLRQSHEYVFFSDFMSSSIAAITINNFSCLGNLYKKNKTMLLNVIDCRFIHEKLSDRFVDN